MTATTADLLVLEVVAGLQKQDGVHYSVIGDRLGDDVAVRALTKLEIDGMVRLRTGRVWLTQRGAELMNRLQSERQPTAGFGA